MAGPDIFSDDHLYVSPAGCLPGWLHRRCLWTIAFATPLERASQAVLNVLRADLVSSQGVLVPMPLLQRVLADYNRSRNGYQASDVPDSPTLHAMPPRYLVAPYNVLTTGPDTGLMPRSVHLQDVLNMDPVYQRYAGPQQRRSLFGPIPIRGAVQVTGPSLYPNMGGAVPLDPTKAPVNSTTISASLPTSTTLDQEHAQLATAVLTAIDQQEDAAQGGRRRTPPRNINPAAQDTYRWQQEYSPEHDSSSPTTDPAPAPAPMVASVVAGPSNTNGRGGRRRATPAPINTIFTTAAVLADPTPRMRSRIPDAPHIQYPACPETPKGKVFECVHCGHHNRNKRDMRRHYLNKHPTATVHDPWLVDDPDPRAQRTRNPNSRGDGGDAADDETAG